MNRKGFSILAGAALLLSSCSLAPKYVQPGAPIPAQWPQGEAYKISRTTPEPTSMMGRDKFFTDLKLQKIIETALANNRDLRLAALNVERVRALYGIQRAEFFPKINAGGSGNRERVTADLSTTGASMITERYGVNLGISSWELDFFGRIRSLKDQALEEYLATEQVRNSAQIMLVSEVARVYLTLAADRANLTLAKSTRKAQLSSLDLIQKRFETGLATDLDLHRAQSQVDVAKRDVARFTQIVAQTQNALNLLAGSQVPEDLLPESLAQVTPLEEILLDLSSNTLLARPDIMAAEHQLKGTYAVIGAARAAFFPRISLTTTIGTASSELSSLFSSGSASWNFAPQIVLPIFDARIWAGLKVSKADRKIALTRYEKTIQTAFREVSDALATKGTISQQVAAQQSLVNGIEKIYNLSNIRYTKGIDSYLSVLDAQRSLYAAQQGLVSLHLAKLTNQVRLYAVLGGGSTRL